MLKPKLLVLLLMVSLLLLACGDEEDAGDDDTPQPTPVAQATADATQVPIQPVPIQPVPIQPVPEATAPVTINEIEAAAGIELSQVVLLETSDVAYNVSYPEGWIAEVAADESAVIVAETESAATALLETGDARATYLAANVVEGTGIAVAASVPAPDVARPTAAELTTQSTANRAYRFGETTPYTALDFYPDATATPFTIGGNSGVLYVLVNDEISVVVWSIGPRRDAVEVLLLEAVAFPLGGFE